MTKWKIGTETGTNELLYLQVWRPDGKVYRRVTQTVYYSSGTKTIAEIPTHMSVSAGDAVGFFIPTAFSVGLRVAWAPVSDYTLLQGMRSTTGDSPIATFTGSHTTLNSSPLLSVILGKCIFIIIFSFNCSYTCSE